jgi:hypothetical protein
MRVQVLFPRQAEFRTSRPKNVIVVENCADLVFIRAARDNFSERRKRIFIRHLAAEGFIPDRYERLSQHWVNGRAGLEWIIEPPREPVNAGSRTALRRILLTLFFSILIWVSLMAFAFLHRP